MNVILYLASFYGKGGLVIKGIAPSMNPERLDRLAIGLSGLCVAHCVATSILLAFVASAGGLLLHPLVHEIGLVLAILLGGIGLGRGLKTHGSLWPGAVGVAGLGMMAVALTRPHDGSEALFTILGAALLAIAHYMNRRAFA